MYGGALESRNLESSNGASGLPQLTNAKWSSKYC